MNQKQVLKKLQALVNKKRLNVPVRNDRVQNVANITKKITVRNISGLIYNKRENRFSNTTGTCEFCPETMEGHSYQWWSMVTRIKGDVYLNTYKYSLSTSKHIYNAEQVLKDLGIKYKTLKAPLGLKNLKGALAYQVSQLATAIVANKYARNKVRNPGSYQLKEIKKLSKLGYKMTKEMLKNAIKETEANRIDALKHKAEARAHRKAKTLIQIVSDFDNTMLTATGLHVVKDLNWLWNDQVYIGDTDQIRADAVREGFTRVIVHREPINQD